MASAGQVTELLLRWQELCEEGRILSAEELCRDCPHLTEDVRHGIEVLVAMAPCSTTDASTADGGPSLCPTHSASTEPSHEPASVRPTLAIPGYEIVAELGRGGMGVVYKARQVALNRLVALKTIRAGASASGQELERFHAEARAVARLQHPNIVQLFEVGQHDGLPFLCLELVEGGSLGERIARGLPQPREAAELIAVLARTLHAAHERGIVHRDLKPGNVLVTADGTPKVADFGLAKLVSGSKGQTESGAVLGTPAYMAPEQAAGKSRDVGPPADVYALGAILYQLLTGRPPFQSDDRLDVILQVLEREPDRPRRHNHLVDAPLEAICLKCLEKAPQERYSSAQALADDLAAYLQGEPVAADPGTNLRVLRVLLQETRHTEVMAQWGKVLMCQAAILFLLSVVLSVLQWLALDQVGLYFLVNSIGCSLLFVPLWYFRLRGGIPLARIERQLAQVWVVIALGVILNTTTRLLTEPEPSGHKAWTLFATSILEFGIGFGCTAAILGGSFYLLAILCAFLGILVAVEPGISPLAFGTAFAIGLFVPGWRFARLGKRMT